MDPVALVHTDPMISEEMKRINSKGPYKTSSTSFLSSEYVFV